MVCVMVVTCRQGDNAVTPSNCNGVRRRVIVAGSVATGRPTSGEVSFQWQKCRLMGEILVLDDLFDVDSD